MNHELKYVHPGSVFVNSLRIFVIVGFIVALLTFFAPGSSMRFSPFGQKLMLTGVFTLVYTLVVSVILTLISYLYNVWAARYRGIRIQLSPDQEG